MITPEEVAETIRKALQYVDADKLLPCTNCGMAPLARHVARGKLDALAAGAEIVRKELAEKAQIPVITTLLGISSFPEAHVLSAGWPGMHGMAYSSLAIEQADLLIALGMRFDDRITGKPSTFATKSKKIHPIL